MKSDFLDMWLIAVYKGTFEQAGFELAGFEQAGSGHAELALTRGMLMYPLGAFKRNNRH